MSEQEITLAERVLKASRDFFAIDLADKQALKCGYDEYCRYQGFRVPGCGPGYRAVAQDANFRTDSRESFNIGWDTSLDPMAPYGMTPWPSDTKVPGFKSTCNAYADLLCSKSKQLRECIAESLGEKADFFDAPGLFDRPPWLLGMVHYQPVPSDISQGRFGIAPHQDGTLFTLLYTDGQPGLQMCPSWSGSGVHREAAMEDDTLEWVDVEPLPGHWIVNLGTLLALWSGGQFKATLHRVVLGVRPADRYSIPFFYEADFDAQIKGSVGKLVDWQQGDSSSQRGSVTPGEILLNMAWRDGLQLLPEQRA